MKDEKFVHYCYFDDFPETIFRKEEIKFGYDFGKHLSFSSYRNMMLLVILFVIKSQAQLNLFNPLVTDGTSAFYVMNSYAAICCRTVHNIER